MTTFLPGAFPRGLRIAPIVFSTTTAGGAASWVVPWDITEIVAKCWGSGGGAGDTNGNNAGGNGGAGGYAQARIAVTPGETLTIFVPTGGIGSITQTRGGTGGSWAGVFRSTTPLLVAGGGGGGGCGYSTPGGNGGPGGGLVGASGERAFALGTATGGTQSAGGSGVVAGAQWRGGNASAATAAGGSNGASSLLGANAGNGGGASSGGDQGNGGGGGAGYYGGGGGPSGSSADDQGGAGGGGGSNFITGTSTLNLQGVGAGPPNQDRNYIAGRGVGGTPSDTPSVRNGGAGLVVILI